MQRKTKTRTDVESLTGGNIINPDVTDKEDDVSKDKSQGLISSILSSYQTILVVVLFFVITAGLYRDAQKGGSSSTSKSINSRLNWVEYPKEGVKVAIEWNESSSSISRKDDVDVKNQGPHRINVLTTCGGVVPYVSISGNVLQSVTMSESKHMSWEGEFIVPISGKYELKMSSPACKSDEIITLKLEEFNVEIDNESNASSSAGKTQPQFKTFKNDMIVKGSWIASSKLNIGKSTSEEQVSKEPSEYVWMNPTLLDKEVNGIDGGANGFVVKEGSITTEHEFYQFPQLSNYELVCFFGSQSAKNLHESLLSLRRQLFPHQRPFKFHYYEVDDLVNPVRTWDEQKQQTFRKCKHILVSIDEPAIPLSQTDYEGKMTTLITHLTKAFDDETFPIWVFTSMESPINSKHCFNSEGLRTTQHPCNVVLEKLFTNENVTPFSQERVRLLDNTDISLSLPNNDALYESLQPDVLGAVALRIFIIVGHQVKVWRDNKQLGHIKGLTKGDVTYPNFELIPYDFSKDV